MKSTVWIIIIIVSVLFSTTYALPLAARPSRQLEGHVPDVELVGRAEQGPNKSSRQRLPPPQSQGPYHNLNAPGPSGHAGLSVQSQEQAGPSQNPPAIPVSGQLPSITSTQTQRRGRVPSRPSQPSSQSRVRRDGCKKCKKRGREDCKHDDTCKEPVQHRQKNCEPCRKVREKFHQKICDSGRPCRNCVGNGIADQCKDGEKKPRKRKQNSQPQSLPIAGPSSQRSFPPQPGPNRHDVSQSPPVSQSPSFRNTIDGTRIPSPPSQYAPPQPVLQWHNPDRHNPNYAWPVDPSTSRRSNLGSHMHLPSNTFGHTQTPGSQPPPPPAVGQIAAGQRASVFNPPSLLPIPSLSSGIDSLAPSSSLRHPPPRQPPPRPPTRRFTSHPNSAPVNPASYFGALDESRRAGPSQPQQPPPPQPQQPLPPPPTNMEFLSHPNSAPDYLTALGSSSSLADAFHEFGPAEH